MKLWMRVRRRQDGTFQATIHGMHGVLWVCHHPHNYGTSNRAKQDSASKCGHAQIKVIRAKLQPQQPIPSSDEGNPA